MIRVGNVTASPCPDKDLPAACIGYALSRHTVGEAKKAWIGGKERERERAKRGEGGRVRGDVIFAIEKSIAGDR